MNIQVITSPKQADKIKGLTVVIDVLRAFTTACYVLANGAQEIISVAGLDEAYALKKTNPHYLLMGERQGMKQSGFDFGNSPAELARLSFPDKTVILTTSAGTQGIQKAIHADEVITGAFVNAGAIARYIQEKHPDDVTLFCTDDWFPENEDVKCAKYIQSLLMGKPMDFKHIQRYMRTHPSADGFLINPLNEWSKRDFELCMTLDTFDFVIKATKGDRIRLTRL